MGIISINNGYFATKVVTSDRKFIFESKIERQIDEYSTAIALNGVRYKVGEGIRDIDLDKSNNTVQLACIVHALEKSNLKEANIITSLPVNLYINKEKRMQYLQKIKELKTEVKINDVKAYMEGAAAQLSDLEWYKGKLIALVDIGGLTINIMIFDNGKLVSGTQDSFNLGTIILDNKIRSALSRSGCDNYTDYQIPYLFSNCDDLVKKIVDTTVYEHLEEIRQTLKKKGYPTKIDYRFTGGGSIRLNNYLIEGFNGYISKNSVWENAIGQYLLGKAVWE